MSRARGQSLSLIIFQAKQQIKIVVKQLNSSKSMVQSTVQATCVSYIHTFLFTVYS